MTDKAWLIKNAEGEYLADYSAPGLPFWAKKVRALEFLEENEARITAAQYGVSENEFTVVEEVLDD